MFCCPKIEPNFQISMLGRFGPLNIIKLPEGCFDVLNVTKLPPLSERFTVQNVTNTPPYQKERKMTDLMVKNLMSVQSSHPWAKALLSKWQNKTNNPPCQKERKMTDLMVKNLMTGSKGRSRSLVAK